MTPLLVGARRSDKLFFLNKGLIMHRQYLDMLSAIVIACSLMFVTVSNALAQPILEPWDRFEIVKVWCSGEREAHPGYGG